LIGIDWFGFFFFVNKANLVHNLFLIYLSISTYFGRLCAHHQEKQLCFCDIWYLLFCVDDILICRSICSCISEYHPYRISSGGTNLCDTWYLLFCVDDCLVCRGICSCIPDSHPWRISSGETTVFMRPLVPAYSTVIHTE